MPLRICPGALMLLLGGFLLSGCQTSPSGSSPSAKGMADAPEDFSAEAVRRRTESHARYANAVLFDLNDQHDKAVEELYQAARVNPHDEELVLEASRRLLHQKQYDKALEIVTAATSHRGASGPLFARLGLVYSLLDRKPDAMEANRTAIRKAPRELVGYQHLAQIHLQDGNAQEAIAVLDQAAKQTEVDAPFLLDLAELYVGFTRASSMKFEEVKPKVTSVLKRAAEMPINHPLQLKKLADIFAVVGDTDKALEIYSGLEDSRPRLPGVREALIELYMRKQDHTKAAEQLEAIVRENPTNPQAYYFLGTFAYQQKDAGKAAEHFRKAILLNADFEQAYYDLALAYIATDEAQKALETLEKASSRFRESFPGRFFTGLAYARMKDYSEAIKHFTAAEVIARAIETNRLNHGFYFQVGAAYERNKDYEEAEKYFRKAIELSPDFGEALNYLGYMWAERGVKLSEARKLIEKAISTDPDNAAYLDSMAWVLYKLGKPKEALEYMLKALEHVEEPDPTLYDHLGDIYMTLDEPGKAREAWKKAVALEPNEDIEKKLRAPDQSSAGPR